MKFELQTKNKVFRNDGTTSTPLERKYGPDDFLVEGSSGVRLESETNGVIEFETGWSRKWPKLQAQLVEAFKMTQTINGVTPDAAGRRPFPFPIPHLHQGDRKELRKGVWKKRPGKEGSREKILTTGEALEVDVVDASWLAGIQSSESFLLTQFESFMKQHESPDFKDPVIISAQEVLDEVNAGKLAPDRVEGLRNFLEMLINYILHGQGGEANRRAVGFDNVRGIAAKQTFALMSRTNFASVFTNLLNKDEKRLYRLIVKKDVILKKMGKTRRTRFFKDGYGSHEHKVGPTVRAWLSGIARGKDLLSSQDEASLSAAMGRFDVETRKGKKDTGLVKYETRAEPDSEGGAFAASPDWAMHGFRLFLKAAMKRPRPTGKDETGLEFS